MKRMNKKLLARMLVFGIAAGMGGIAMANPYGHGMYGPGYMGGMCWGYDGGASAGNWREVAKQRTADLHGKLKLNATQEKAWQNYQATISANVKAMQEREMMDFSSMTAPQRLEKSQQMLKERDARMASHLEALKAFYSTLTPEQQQIFDAETGPGRYGYHRGGRGYHGGPRY